MIQKIDNQQLCSLNRNQVQVLVSGEFGDGHIALKKSGKGVYKTNCKYLEYLEFKQKLLGNISGKIGYVEKNGYNQNEIYTLSSKTAMELKIIKELDIKTKLSLLDDLGLALWFYDDGSLHRRNGFFNLNTHNYDENTHYNIFVPFFEKLGMKPQVYRDNKKDGRSFCYLYFGKHFGAYEIMKILSKYPIECYKYKLWSSTTIQDWSKLKVELKRRGITVTPRKFTNILNGKAVI